MLQQQEQQLQQQAIKPVQKRTKSACVNCQNAKVACSEMRPCLWCLRHKVPHECTDAPKKARKRKTPEQPSPTTDAPISNPLIDSSLIINTPGVLIQNPQFSFPIVDATTDAPYLSVFDDIEDFSIDSILNSSVFVQPPLTTATISPVDQPFVPNLDFSPTNSTIVPSTTASSSSSSTKDDSLDYSSLIMAEIKRAQSSMENVALLSQLQNSSNNLPAAVIRIPDMLISECNDAFGRLLEYNSGQEILNARLSLLDIVFPQLRAIIQRRAAKYVNKKEPKIVRTALLQTRISTAKCCTLVLKPTGNSYRMTVLRHSNGVPERAARKLECISALHQAKQKRISEEAWFGNCEDL